MDPNAINLLLSVVGTGVLVGGIIWAIERRKERNDITNIGVKVNKQDDRMTTIESNLNGLQRMQADDRLAYERLLNASEARITAQQSQMLQSMARLEERFDTVALLKAVLYEGERK